MKTIRYLLLASSMLLISKSICAQDAATTEGQRTLRRHTRFVDAEPIREFDPNPIKLSPQRFIFAPTAPAVYGSTAFIGTTANAVMGLIPNEIEHVYPSIAGASPCSPAVSGKMVYAAFEKSNVTAYNKESEKVVWQAETSGVNNTTPLLVENVLYVSSTDGHCYAYDARSGRMIWKFLALGECTSPSFDSDVVYIGSAANRTYALRAEDGKKLWEYDGAAGIAVVGDNEIFVRTDSGAVVALSKSHGKKKWMYKEGLQFGTKELALAGNTLIIVSGKNTIALDASSGKEVKWSKTFPKDIASAPLVVRDVVYIALSNGDVYAFDLSSGSQVTRFEMSYVVTGTMSFGNGVMYLANEQDFYFLTAKKSGTDLNGE